LVYLAIFAGFGPAMTVVNSNETPGVATAITLWLAITCLGVGFRWILVRFGLDPTGATFAVSLLLLATLNTGDLVEAFPGGRLTLLVLCLVAATAVYVLRRRSVIRYAFSWACLALALAPVVTIAQHVEFDQPAAVEFGADLEAPPLANKPDVVVIVADGYANAESLAAIYGYDNRPFLNQLTALGGEVNHHMRSNYARTKLSVPSFLQMGYIPDQTPIAPSFEAHLLRILGGENRLAEIMGDNGYRTVYLESGWLGTDCSDNVDICVGNAWPDETAYDIAHRSIFRDAPGFETGRSFGRGAVRTFGELEVALDTYLRDDQPDFIYSHLLAPHPPLFLNSDCEMNPSKAMSGFAIAEPKMSPAEVARRRLAYVDQVECVNQVILKAFESVAESADVLLVFGDHGPDSGAQLFVDATAWTDAQKNERFGVLFAGLHEGCDYSEIGTLVNAGRQMLSCLSDADLTELPDRYFDLDKMRDVPAVVEVELHTKVAP
jgi:hypothetical protein